MTTPSHGADTIGFDEDNLLTFISTLRSVADGLDDEAKAVQSQVDAECASLFGGLTEHNEPAPVYVEFTSKLNDTTRRLTGGIASIATSLRNEAARVEKYLNEAKDAEKSAADDIGGLTTPGAVV